MNSYLDKHKLTGSLFDIGDFLPDIIVCIPVLDEPLLLDTLDSLHQSKASYSGQVLVLVLYNHSEEADVEIRESNHELFSHFAKATEPMQSSTLVLMAHLMEFTPKAAGVGLARKILMDEGVRLFALAGKKDGILVGLDGDSTVASNYFQEIANYFIAHPKKEAASIHFEHPLPEAPKERTAIIQYELHLRYFVEAQKMSGLPTAYQTIGSSMAVRHIAYQMQGGMNRRKAGEDFYFLQKFARKGTLGNLTQTTVFPSPRISNRVPFGTGRAMGQLLETDELLLTHQVIIFDQIKLLFEGVPMLWNKSASEIIHFSQSMLPAVQDFLSENGFLQRITEIQRHTAGQAAFVKRFYNWFDGFVMMKYVHYARDNYYPDDTILLIAHAFARREMGYDKDLDNEATLLEFYRAHHKTVP